MATLKIKKVKGREYFYWSKSVRSRKRYGGDGRVKTVDYLVGTHPIGGQWLGYHLWSRNIDLQQYTQALIRWYIGINKWQEFVNFTIDWNKNKVSLKGLIPPMQLMGIVFGVDCRSQQWRKVREDFQNALNHLLERSTLIESIIERAAYYVALHDEYTAEAEKLRSFARDARLNADKYKPDADLHLNEYALEFESEADKAVQRYLEIVNDKLLVFAPPKQRSKFKTEAIIKAERLAKDRRWFEEYQDRLERERTSNRDSC